MKPLSRKWPILAAALVLMPAAQLSRAESRGRQQQSEAKIEIPAAVLKAIRDNAPGAEIDTVAVEENAGLKLYDIEFKADRGEIEVAEDGTVIDIVVVVQMKDIPKAAAAALEKAAAQARAAIRRLEKSEIRAEVQIQEGRGRVVRLAAPRYVYEAELVRGLDLGADDYLVKPFAFEELLARVRALARRAYQVRNPRLEIGDLHIDTAAQRVRYGAHEVRLTAREYALLEYLALRAGEVVSRADIWEHVYDFRSEADSNVVDVYIGYLRRKLERAGAPRLIHTLRGRGYSLRTAP